MKKVLLFSSLKKPKDIIELTISSWLSLNSKEDLSIDILVYDDQYDDDSSKLVTSLVDKGKIQLADFTITQEDNYKGDHLWNEKQVDKISQIKNKAIQYALKHEYDYLFLVDADLVLNSNTLEHLLSLKKDFVFEVFWTLFYGEAYHKPNAWDYHSWGYHSEESILQLSKPGTYKVGGGGACTLLSKEILQKGLNFDRMSSINFNGEDRHFCTRAQALGYDIYVDTHYPVYHIFNQSQLPEAKQWFKNGATSDLFVKLLDDDWVKLVKTSFNRPRGFINDFKFFLFSIYKSFKRSYHISFKK